MHYFYYILISNDINMSKKVYPMEKSFNLTKIPLSLCQPIVINSAVFVDRVSTESAVFIDRVSVDSTLFLERVSIDSAVFLERLST